MDIPYPWFDRTPLGVSPPTYVFRSVNGLGEYKSTGVAGKFLQHTDNKGAYALNVRRKRHGFTKTTFEIKRGAPWYKAFFRRPKTVATIEHWYAPGEGNKTAQMNCTDFHLFDEAVSELPDVHGFIEAALKAA